MFRINTGGNSEQENTLNQLLVEMDGNMALFIIDECCNICHRY